MIKAARKGLTRAGAVCRRFGKEGRRKLSLPSFLFGAASASGICWLAQASSPPSAAAIVLLSIAVLSTGWLVTKSGTRTVREPSTRDYTKGVISAKEGGNAPRLRCPEVGAGKTGTRMPPTGGKTARTAGELPEKEHSPTAFAPDRFRSGCKTIADKAGLSSREREILELLARGRNTRYIQEAFVIAPSTVKSHTYRIYRKLGVHSRQELIDEVEAAQGKEGGTEEKASGNKIYVFRTDGQGKRTGSAPPRRRAQQ